MRLVDILNRDCIIPDLKEGISVTKRKRWLKSLPSGLAVLTKTGFGGDS